MSERTSELAPMTEVVQEYAVRTPTGRIVDYNTSLLGALAWLDTDRELGRASVLMTRTRTVTVTGWTESLLPAATNPAASGEADRG